MRPVAYWSQVTQQGGDPLLASQHLWVLLKLLNKRSYFSSLFLCPRSQPGIRDRIGSLNSHS